MTNKLKNAKITEQKQLEFFQKIESMPLEELRVYCIDMIKNSQVPNHTMMHEMKTDSRANIIFKANDFILKGHGLGMTSKRGY